MATMKAIQIHAYGGSENLKYDEVPRPEPRSWQIICPGGVLVSTLGVPESGIPHGIQAVPVFANLRASSQLQQIAQLIDDGQIKVSVEQIFELAEAAKAQEISQHGHPRGKLVLQVVHPSSTH